VAGGVSPLANLGARLYGWAWEARRSAYATGMRRPRHVRSRVISIGNLTVGGTGKTTLALHLAGRLREAGQNVAVVCRDYRPGPAGRGDEALLMAAALGEARVFSGRRKWEEATRAAAAGFDPILVDDGFSHWGLGRDLDIVLLDAHDPWGGGELLPAGRLREPRRALQRAGILIVSRATDSEMARATLAAVTPFAPAALGAAGRHRLAGVRSGAGGWLAVEGGARVVTATGHPSAVADSAREAGYNPVVLSAYRDHHWFTEAEVRLEQERAAAAGLTLLITAKDAVRWPLSPGPAVLEVVWEWVVGGEEVEARVLASQRTEPVR